MHCSFLNLRNPQEILGLESALQHLSFLVGANGCNPFCHKTWISIGLFHRYNFEHRIGVAESN